MMTVIEGSAARSAARLTTILFLVLQQVVKEILCDPAPFFLILETCDQASLVALKQVQALLLACTYPLCLLELVFERVKLYATIVNDKVSKTVILPLAGSTLSLDIAQTILEFRKLVGPSIEPVIL